MNRLTCTGYPYYCVECEHGDTRRCGFLCRRRDYQCSNACGCPCARPELRGDRWQEVYAAFMTRRQRHEQARKRDRERRDRWLAAQGGDCYPWSSGPALRLFLPGNAVFDAGPLEETG